MEYIFLPVVFFLAPLFIFFFRRKQRALSRRLLDVALAMFILQIVYERIFGPPIPAAEFGMVSALMFILPGEFLSWGLAIIINCPAPL